MKMKRRFLFFVIWISVMVLLFASVLTMKAFADENDSKERTLDEFIEYELWIGGVQVTSYNCHDILDAEDPATGKPTASFNPETKVLELHNPVFKDYSEGALVYSCLDYLKIKGTLDYYGEEEAFFGFYSPYGDCMELFEDEEVKTDIRMKIFKGQGGACIDNSYGDIIIRGGNIYLEHSSGKAIYCDNLSVEGGKLHLKNTNNWECLMAYPGDIKLQNNMRITTPKDGRVRTISTQYGDQVFTHRTITGPDPNNEEQSGASEIVIEESDGLSDTYTLTLHWSSMDGVDITGQYPISLSGIKSGTSVSEALSEYGFYDLDRTKFFNKNGYTDTHQRNYKPMNDFSAEQDINDTRVFSSDLITEDMDIYCYMGKNIDTLTFSVDAPICGSSFSSKPIVHLPKDSHVSVYYSRWVESGNTIQAGKEYEAIFEISADFKYAFTDNVVAFINGEKIKNNGYTVYGDYTFIVKTKAVHSIKKVAAKAATCGKAGNKEYWTCSGCKKIFSDAAGIKETTASAMTIKPTGKHTWNKGKVTKNPTLTADGEMLYTCTVCKSTKKETIPKLAIDTMDIGNVWTNLSPVQGIAFTTAFDQDGKLNKQMEFADQWWQDVTKGATGGKQIHINENKLPELGHTYQFYVKIKPKKGYVFDNAKFKKFIYGGKEVAAKNYTKTLNKDGSITLTWGLKAKTTPENLNNKTLGVTVTGVVDKAYTGKAITQSPVVKAKVKGKVVTLKNGTDYTLSYKNNTAQGTATVIVTGKGKYTGTKNVSFKITHTHKWDAGKVTKQPTTAAAGVKTFTCSVCKATRSETIAKLPIKDPALRRISGGNRFKTSFAIAETYMKETKQTKLNSIIVASSTTFADALAGSYLAKSKNAPIIIWHKQLNKDVQTFIKQKVKTGGTVYILGGTVAVGDSIKQNMGGYKFVRLADRSRYGTNTKILDAGGLNKTEVIVCDGGGDGKGINALIASATGKPLLLVDKNGLIPIQKTWLGKNKGKITKFVIVGDGKSVSTKVESELKAYGTVSRISGKNADEISAQVASTYYKNAKEVFIATMNDYPDGLCGGPLAVFAKGPILLVNEKANTASTIYVKTLTNLERATVFGGATAMPEALARKVAKNTKAKLTIIEK